MDNWPPPRAQPAAVACLRLCSLLPATPRLGVHMQSTECPAWMALVGVGISGWWLTMNQTELGRKRGCERSWRWDLSPWGEGTGLCFFVGHMERGSGPSRVTLPGKRPPVPGGRDKPLYTLPSRRVGEGENRAFGALVTAWQKV